MNVRILVVAFLFLFQLSVFSQGAIIEWTHNQTISQVFTVDSEDTLVIHQGVFITISNTSYIEVLGKIETQGSVEIVTANRGFYFRSGSSGHISDTRFSQVEPTKAVICSEGASIRIDRSEFNVVYGIQATNGSVVVANSKFRNVQMAFIGLDTRVKMVNNEINMNTITTMSEVILSEGSGKFDIWDSRIHGGMTLSTTRSISIENNTIENGYVNINKASDQSSVEIKDNFISSVQNLPALYIGIYGGIDVIVSGNTLHSNSFSSVQMAAIGSQAGSMIYFNSNIVNKKVSFISQDYYQLSIGYNRFESVEYPLSITTTGATQIINNVFINFKTAIDLVEGSTVISNNLFQNGILIIGSKITAKYFTFSNNTVTGCNMVFDYKTFSTGGELVLENNVFDSNECLAGKSLVSYDCYVTPALSISVSGNLFKNIVTNGPSAVSINIQRANKLDIAIKSNKFIGLTSPSVELRGSNNNMVSNNIFLKQNIFENPKAPVDLNVTGFTTDKRMDATYNYWGAIEWIQIQARVSDPGKHVSQSPFFLSAAVTDYNATNIGKAPNPSKKPSLAPGVIVGIIIGSVAILLVLLIVIAGGVAVAVKKTKIQYHTLH